MILMPPHNKVSKHVDSYEEVEPILEELAYFIDETNGRFKGQYDTAYAIAHCQVSMQPLAISVVAKEYVKETRGAEVPDELIFRSRFFINPRIIDVPEKTLKKVKREDPLTGHLVEQISSVKNVVRVPEGCMSFPHKKAKNVDRAYEVKVEYQIPVKSLLGGMKLKTVRETVTGLKAHIFQHECDHMQGKNIFYGNRAR